MSRISILLIITGLLTVQGCSKMMSTQYRADHMSNDEILTLLQDRNCHMVVNWQGANRCQLDETGYSCSGHLPLEHSHFSYTQCRKCKLVDKALFDPVDGRLKKDPFLLIPLFDSRDSDTVLTTLLLYRRRAVFPEELNQIFDNPNPLSDSLRKLLFQHKDVRVRWLALSLLKEFEWLDVEDLSMALADDDVCIRDTGARCVDEVFKRTIRNYPEKEDQIKEQLITLCIESLNDNYFCVRSTCYWSYVRLTQRRKYVSATSYTLDNPLNRPARFDFVRESWWKRVEAQQEIRNWWQQNREDILQFANSNRPLPESMLQSSTQ